MNSYSDGNLFTFQFTYPATVNGTAYTPSAATAALLASGVNADGSKIWAFTATTTGGAAEVASALATVGRTSTDGSVWEMTGIAGQAGTLTAAVTLKTTDIDPTSGGTITIQATDSVAVVTPVAPFVAIGTITDQAGDPTGVSF